MNAREVIARAVCQARCHAGRPDPGKGLDEFIADAIITALEAAGMAIVPVEAEYLDGHHLYCAALPPDHGTCTCGLAAAKDQTDG